MGQDGSNDLNIEHTLIKHFFFLITAPQKATFRLGGVADFGARLDWKLWGGEKWVLLARHGRQGGPRRTERDEAEGREGPFGRHAKKKEQRKDHGGNERRKIYRFWSEEEKKSNHFFFGVIKVLLGGTLLGEREGRRGLNVIIPEKAHCARLAQRIDDSSLKRLS